MALIDPRPSLVLFDLDDTLCDYASARWLRLRIAFDRALGLLPERPDIDLDRLARESIEIHPHGVDHFDELLARHGASHAESAAAAKEWYRTNRFYGLRLFDDALETLRAVRDAVPGRRIGIITNGPTETQHAKIDLLAIRPLFDFILISEEFGCAKPDARIFEEALRLGDADPETSVFIGDSLEFDMAGARNAGMRGVWVNRHHHPQPGTSHAPEHVVADLAQVRKLLG
jgi:putative hydrolase of the HAD superfamily